MLARKSEIEIHPNRSINMDIGKILGIKKMNISTKCWNSTGHTMIKLNTKFKKFQTKFHYLFEKPREFSSFRSAFPLSMLSIFFDSKYWNSVTFQT